MTTSATGQPADENTTESPGGPDSMLGTSERQIKANRENAKKSTGPRTPEGKARSSQNPRKHHVFVSAVEPVEDGMFVEDADRFYERVEAIVDSLRPRDAIELELATRIAGVMIKLERLDRWSAISIESAASMTTLDYEIGLRPQAEVEYWEPIARAYFLYLTGVSNGSEPDYREFATLIRYQGPEPRVGVKGLWNDDKTPSSDEEWRKAFLALKAHHWKTDEAALAWAYDKFTQFSHRWVELSDYERKTASRRILNGPFDLQIRYEARLANTLRTLMKEYGNLQRREFGD